MEHLKAQRKKIKSTTKGKSPKRGKKRHSTSSALSEEESGIVSKRPHIRTLCSCIVNLDDEHAAEVDRRNSQDDEDSLDIESHQCRVCDKVFTDYGELKKHRVGCTKIPKKFKCRKCGKGFQQKNLLQQHYDYRHTRKPKQFVCDICNKNFELKKTWKEHMTCLHSTNDYKYMCDHCGQGFFILGEFKVHHLWHTNVKSFACGRCGIAKYNTQGRLNTHLEKCGKKKTVKCKVCSKYFSSVRLLSTHVSEVHGKKVNLPYPLCENSNFTSKGRYYKHHRTKHDITRMGKQIEEAILDREIEKRQRDEPDNLQSSEF